MAKEKSKKDENDEEVEYDKQGAEIAPVTKKLKEKEERQTMWVFVVIGLMIVVFLGTYFYVKSLDKFEYLGVEWQKAKNGDIVFYYSQFKFFENAPVYNLFLRNDPRKNDVPFNAVLALKDEEAVITFEPEMDECKGFNTMIKIALSDFFKALGYDEVEGAVSDMEYSKNNKINYATCDSVVGKSVVWIRKAEEDSIEQIDDCYVINVGRCEIKVVERFILGMLEKLNKGKE